MAIKFENISVGKKLGLGFFLVLLMTIIIAGSSIIQVESLRNSISKLNLSHSINDEVNQAKYYRAAYGSSYNPDYFKQNITHIENIITLISQAKAMSWSEGNRQKFDQMTPLIASYQSRQKSYNEAIVKKNAIRESWNISATEGTLKQLGDNLTAASDSQTQQLLLSEVNTRLMAVRYQVRGLLLSPGSKSEAGLSQSIDDAQRALASLTLSLSDEQRAILSPVLDIMNSYGKQALAWQPAWQQEMSYAAEMAEIAGQLNEVVMQLLHDQLQLTQQDISRSKIQLAATALITLLLGVMIAWFIYRQITTPLNQTLALAERIATGDLTASSATPRRDELGQLLNAMAKMNNNLHGMIDEIRIGVSHISSASGEISAGNTDLSSRTEQQAAAVEQTAASMEQLTATVKQNAENAHHANELAIEASDTARQGGKQIDNVVSTMTHIEQSSRKIADITSVINGIAFQTNILALNAAVEAARAGEQGRGFAVVAGEVRSLAQRSAQAAKEIEELIKQSVAQVSDGATLVADAGKTMQHIVNSVTHVHDIMQEISSASDEQSRGIAQVSQAIVEIDSTTQQNAALVEQSSAASDSLQEQAMLLTRAVSVFRLSRSSGDTPPISAVPAATAHALNYRP
ncbi:HAMP domain-containing protein [Affinibrenneria salicis]|uniref:HAMP domain-containing protein n=1 Tax=Affinibrenneria salicis TaxID=2590031 RepID=A0A5J5FWW2_9GAMM|nr:methyl-accepting chemotaxis protein [Affinibrenneria salicis]KAA8997351.1 HAMP domain-containing protein [Affinibrenneria salicis]